MKKLLIATIAASALATPALAKSDSTLIGANIATVCTITAPADDTNLDLGSTASQPLGQVSATCNDANGFTASVSSNNNGQLEASNSTTAYPYTLDVDQIGSVDISGGKKEVMSSNVGGPAVIIDGESLDIGVQLSGPDGPAFAGNYRDTLVFEITGN